MPKHPPKHKVNESQRRLVWEAMLDADYRARYFGELASRYQTRSKRLHVGLAILTSGAFLAIVGDWLPYLPEVMAVLAAGLSWFLAFRRYGERAKDGASLGRQWSQIASELAVLWAEIDDLDQSLVLERWQKIDQSHAAMDEIAMSKFRYERKLATTCYDEMLAAHGLTTPA